MGQGKEADYLSPRLERMEVTDEQNQTTFTEYSYGEQYNQLIEIREYSYNG